MTIAREAKRMRRFCRSLSSELRLPCEGVERLPDRARTRCLRATPEPQPLAPGNRADDVLLLHGFAETHVMWHRVAPALAESVTVVCADLRGYGASGTPPSTSDHAPYAKAAMAGDMVTVMDHLGFGSFSVVGHDRGGRVGYRLALGYWPWSLLAQPEPLPERLIAAVPDAFVDAALGGWGSDPEAFPADIRNVYIEVLSDPATAHAICLGDLRPA